MKQLKKYFILFLMMAIPLWSALEAEAVNNVADYTSVPPVMTVGGMDPNLLLLIDNSSSMSDLAYVNDQRYCYDDNYDPSATFVGYFEPETWYGYNFGAAKFEATAPPNCALYTYSQNDVCVSVDATPSVTAFAAKGNFLNWATASKLDIQKEILTGGKYDAVNNRLVPEARGCVDRRYVKKVALLDSSSKTYYLTLAVRPPTEDEKADASDDTTRIEVFELTDEGFNNTDCQGAIDELESETPNQGQIKDDIEDCLIYKSKDKVLANTMSAFNHSIHECWYKSKHGEWHDGVTRMKNACENIYEDLWAIGSTPADITPDDRGYVCYGDFATTAGYVGRCWDEALATRNAVGDILVPGWISDVCISDALQDYCQGLELTEVVDPTDQADQTITFWNIPAVLVDSAVMAQLGEPLAVLKGHVAQSTPPTGILQEVVDDLRIGAMSFNDNGAKSECALADPHILYKCADPAIRDGGRIIAAIDQGGAHTTTLVSAINEIKATTWTPMAEAMYNAIGYYTQNTALRLNAADFSTGTDPITAWCQANNILIITDGASTTDQNADVSTFASGAGQNDGADGDPAGCPTLTGSTLLDDLTYYAKHGGVGIYPAGQGQIDGEDKRNITTHIVVSGNLRSTGVDECSPDVLLTSAAQNGGTSLYLAEDPSTLEDALREAFHAIREGATATTAVSVLATSGEGEGTLYQAYFKPRHATATEETNWVGFLQSLWVDAEGNLREDWTSSGDHTPDGTLDLSVDPIVNFSFDPSTSATKFTRLPVSSADPFGESSTPSATLSLTELSPLWEAGEKLASRDILANPRTIYTFVDLDGSESVNENWLVDNSATGEFISLTAANQGKLKAYLDLPNDPVTPVEDYDYLGGNETDRVANLIEFIGGSDDGSLRNRTVDSKVWRLGDIIYSTPTPIGRPVDNYDLIYGDQTYLDYYRRHKGRETVVYLGANDGMLHAFLAGVYHPGSIHSGRFAGDGAYFGRDPAIPTDGLPTDAYPLNKYSSLGNDWRGTELWAYIPQNLLPHLKWLADPDYTSGNNRHVSYVDLKPRIFDAQVYMDADQWWNPLFDVWFNMSPGQKADRANGWATLLVGGMRFGGGDITVTGDFDADAVTPATTRTFTSAYFCIDITDPLNPVLLWDRTYPGLGFTTSFPAVVKVDDKTIDHSTDPDTVTSTPHWYLLFGSGPTDYNGNSNQNGRIFLVDVATGAYDAFTNPSNPGRIFTQLTNADGTDSGTPLPANGFMGSPISVDLLLDYSVNVSYIGDIHEDGALPGGYGGGLYRLKTPTTPDTVDGQPVLLYDNDPATWTLTQMFNAKRPVTAAPAAAVAIPWGGVSSDALWIYFGTGRYLNQSDKTDTTTQYLYGIKDPYFNNDLAAGERTTLLNLEPLDKDANNLFNATSVEVYTDGSTSAGVDFSILRTRQDYGESFGIGWYRALEASGERIMSKPTVVGGILLAPSFAPNDADACGFGGDSYLYALYFETGTAFYRSVIGLTADADAPAGEMKVLDKTSLGKGLASSLGIHVGRESGAKGFIQQSTGTVTEIDLEPAFSVKSGFINWREK
jgi:type IV pilus assembly protein PilY1